MANSSHKSKPFDRLSNFAVWLSYSTLIPAFSTDRFSQNTSKVINAVLNPCVVHPRIRAIGCWLTLMLRDVAANGSKLLNLRSFHLCSNQDSWRPYTRKIPNLPLLGMVASQLASFPSGAVGPKERVILPPAFTSMHWFLLLFFLNKGGVQFATWSAFTGRKPQKTRNILLEGLPAQSVCGHYRRLNSCLGQCDSSQYIVIQYRASLQRYD